MGRNDGTGWGHAGTDAGSKGKASKPIYSTKGGGSSKPPKKGSGSDSMQVRVIAAALVAIPAAIMAALITYLVVMN